MLRRWSESSAEARFQLDLQVPQAALMSFIPSGWTTNVSTRGPATDANLRAIFLERLTINGPEGRPVGDGSNILVYLTVPVCGIPPTPTGSLRRSTATASVPTRAATSRRAPPCPSSCSRPDPSGGWIEPPRETGQAR